MHTLPSLNALRAFEAAARHLSFKEAAAELYVTPGAVSQQVKALEDELGLALFHRHNRAITLTEAGQGLLPVATEAFRRLSDTVERLRANDRAGVLTISVLPSFAAKWLVPRLGRFGAAHPEIDVRISATTRLVDFKREDVDVGIRHGAGHYPGLHAERLMGEALFPVCSPALLEGPNPLRTPADLAHHTLLHDDGHNDWTQWLRLVGAPEVNPLRGAVFNDAAIMLQAAIAGHGVAIARTMLVEEDLAMGRLVRPFEQSLPYDLAYYLVCLPETAEKPKVAAFRAWVQAEAAGVSSGQHALADLAGDCG